MIAEKDGFFLSDRVIHISTSLIITTIYFLIYNIIIFAPVGVGKGLSKEKSEFERRQ